MLVRSEKTETLPRWNWQPHCTVAPATATKGAPILPMITRRSFIARAAAFVAGVRLAIEGAVVDFAAPESFAQVKPAMETTGMRIDPDTLEFEYLSETGWINTGPALEARPVVALPGEEDIPLPHPAGASWEIRSALTRIQNGSLTRCWKKASMPKQEVLS
jgi:hypothetical protein